MLCLLLCTLGPEQIWVFFLTRHTPLEIISSGEWKINNPSNIVQWVCTDKGELIITIRYLRTIIRFNKRRELGSRSSDVVSHASLHCPVSALQCWDSEGELFISRDYRQVDSECQLCFDDYDISVSLKLTEIVLAFWERIGGLLSTLFSNIFINIYIYRAYKTYELNWNTWNKISIG